MCNLNWRVMEKKCHNIKVEENIKSTAMIINGRIDTARVFKLRTTGQKHRQTCQSAQCVSAPHALVCTDVCVCLPYLQLFGGQRFEMLLV